MSVAELIAELQRWPGHKPVRVRIDSFIVDTEIGEKVVLGPDEAVPLDCVVYEGAFVCLEA